MPADAPLLCSPPHDELFMEGSRGIFEEEKDLPESNTRKVDKNAQLGSFCGLSLAFSPVSMKQGGSYKVKRDGAGLGLGLDLSV